MRRIYKCERTRQLISDRTGLDPASPFFPARRASSSTEVTRRCTRRASALKVTRLTIPGFFGKLPWFQAARYRLADNIKGSRIDPADLSKIKWEKRRKIGYPPSTRSGCSMTLWQSKGMGVCFGGVVSLWLLETCFSLLLNHPSRLFSSTTTATRRRSNPSSTTTCAFPHLCSFASCDHAYALTPSVSPTTLPIRVAGSRSISKRRRSKEAAVAARQSRLRSLPPLPPRGPKLKEEEEEPTTTTSTTRMTRRAETTNSNSRLLSRTSRRTTRTTR